MTIRLREETPPPFNYFSIMPNELVCHILSDCEFKKRKSYIAPQYLSHIAKVCKVWNNLIHDITSSLLNKGEIRLVHIPFIDKVRNVPYRQAYFIFQYLKFLNGEVSLEEIKRLSTNQFRPFVKDNTFQNRKLVHLDLADLRHVNGFLITRLEPFFKNFETVKRAYCSYSDTRILPKFTHIKHLNITPNYNTDLSFIPTLVKLDQLTLHFFDITIFTNVLDVLSRTTSISNLNLSTSIYPCLEFPDKFQLPNQLKDLSLKGFNFTPDIFDSESNIECLNLRNIHLKNRTFSECLKNLKHLSIHIREDITTLKIQDLELEFFHIKSIFLEELTMENCHIGKIDYNCPNIKVL